MTVTYMITKVITLDEYQDEQTRKKIEQHNEERASRMEGTRIEHVWQGRNLFNPETNRLESMMLLSTTATLTEKGEDDG